MAFTVAADSYDRFMGTFARPLATAFADFVQVRPASSVLDVGCGPGALLGELLARGVEVQGVDPSPPFVAAARERFPGTEVLEGTVEALPYADAAFDATLAQLVLHHVADASAGAAEMARVTRPGGAVAACVWDLEEGPLATFWRAVVSLKDEPAPPDTPARALQREGGLEAVLAGAGLDDVIGTTFEVEVRFDSFDDWWSTFELGVGPPGAHVARLDQRGRAALRERCRELMMESAPAAAPFTVRGIARAARGIR
jgi:SAM-dependent methyltransferase